jgi:hypothetical protein
LAAEEVLLSPSEPFSRLRAVVVVELEDEELEGVEDAPVARLPLPLSSQVQFKVQLPLRRRIVVYVSTVANLAIVKLNADSHGKRILNILPPPIRNMLMPSEHLI